MGSSSLEQVSANIASVPRRLVEEGAERFDQLARASAAQTVPGGVMHVHRSGGRRDAVQLGTAATFEEHGDQAVAHVFGTPAAQWVWIEDGIRPHPIGRDHQLLGGSLRHPVRGPVVHKGVAGHGAWTRAVEVIDHEYVLLAEGAVEVAIRA